MCACVAKPFLLKRESYYLVKMHFICLLFGPVLVGTSIGVIASIVYQILHDYAILRTYKRDVSREQWVVAAKGAFSVVLIPCVSRHDAAVLANRLKRTRVIVNTRRRWNEYAWTPFIFAGRYDNKFLAKIDKALKT